MFFVSKSVLAQKNDLKLQGLYVHTIYFGSNKNNSMTIYKQDTLFVNNSMVLELLKTISDTDFLNKQSRKIVASGYNIIDFNNKKYAAIENLSKKTNLKFVPFQRKVNGFEINFKYYNGEKFVESEIKLDGLTLKKIVFTPNTGQMKGQIFTAYLRKPYTASEPSFAPNLESKFGGRIYQLELETPSGEEKIVRKLIFKPLIKDPNLTFLKSLKN